MCMSVVLAEIDYMTLFALSSYGITDQGIKHGIMHSLILSLLKFIDSKQDFP